MFLFLLVFLTFYGFYFYFSYQVILLNDLGEIFSQTASKAQADLKGYVELVLEDLGRSYQSILVIIFCAAILTFIWILMLKYNANIIIWLSIFSLPVALSVGAYYSIKIYMDLHKCGDWNANDPEGFSSFCGDEQDDNQQKALIQSALQDILAKELLSYVRNETLWLSLSILLCVILTVSVILLHSLRERVSLSIALIRQASKAINGIKTTLVFPIIPRTLGIAVIIYGILVSLLIIAASHPTYRFEGGPDHGKPCSPRLFNKSSPAIIPSLRPTISPTKLTSERLPAPARLQLPISRQVSGNEGGNVLFSGRVSDRNRDQPQQQAPPSIGFIHNQNSNNSNNNNSSNILQASQNLMTITSASNNSNIFDNSKPRCVNTQPLRRQHVWKYHAINLFATLWLIHFISGVSQTTLAGAFASYYWAYRKPRDVPFFAVTISFFRVLRNHLGDIAFGSFLIATIRYIRIVIEFIDNRIRRKKNNSNAHDNMAKSLTCFFRIFFWLLDRFLKYIDRNAYIMMSMYGEGYLASAKRAVELLYQNSTRAIVLDYVTYFVLLMSRLLITGVAGYITAQKEFTAELHYKWLPTLLVVLGTYFISKGLFSVYSMAVDTLFICFLLDSTNNDGTAERPYFMSKELRKIVKRSTVRIATN